VLPDWVFDGGLPPGKLKSKRYGFTPPAAVPV
jgi:hypothetical protein